MGKGLSSKGLSKEAGRRNKQMKRASLEDAKPDGGFNADTCRMNRKQKRKWEKENRKK